MDLKIESLIQANHRQEKRLRAAMLANEEAVRIVTSVLGDAGSPLVRRLREVEDGIRDAMASRVEQCLGLLELLKERKAAVTTE